MAESILTLSKNVSLEYKFGTQESENSYKYFKVLNIPKILRIFPKFRELKSANVQFWIYFFILNIKFDFSSIPITLFLISKLS